MNILIYYDNQLCPTTGGTERVACILSDYLKKQGHNLYFLCCNASKSEVSIDSEFLPDNTSHVTQGNINKVLQIIKDHGIDVIINESAFNNAIYLFSHDHIPNNIKIITHLHFDPESGIKTFYRTLNLPIPDSSLPKTLTNLLKWIKSPYNKFKSIQLKKNRFRYILNTSDKLVVISPKHKDTIQKLVQTTYNNIIAISNPISFPAYDLNDITKHNEIIYVGRLEYKAKRVDRVLEVWRHLHLVYKDWRLTIIGDGEDRVRLEKLSKSLKLTNISFGGNQDPTSYYLRSKILLLTSNFEASGMVINEAMAFGVIPIVINSYSAASDMINNGYNGFLTKAFDLSQMAQAIELLINNENQLKQLSENAQATIRNIDNDKVLANWGDIILD